MHGAAHPEVYEKYNLFQYNRNPKVVSNDKIHEIFIENYFMTGNTIGTNFGDRERFYDYVAVICDLYKY